MSTLGAFFVERQACNAKCFEQSDVARRRRLLNLSAILAAVAVWLTLAAVLGHNLYRSRLIDDNGNQAYVRIPILHNMVQGPCHIDARDEHVYPGSFARVSTSNKFELTCIVDKPRRVGIFFALASLTVGFSIWLFIVVTRSFFLEAQRKLHEISFRLSYWCLVVAVFTIFNLIAMASQWCVNAASCQIAEDGIMILIAFALWILCAFVTCIVFKKTQLVAVAPIQVDVEEQQQQVERQEE